MYGGYFGKEKARGQRFVIPKGQDIAGHAIGIVHLEVWYPLLPGNVVNATTYNFPVRYKALRKATIPRILKADPGLLDLIIEAGHEFEQEGVRAMVGACGYFANYQREVSAALEIPVFLSSLLQVPMIQRALKPEQRLGILFADASAVNRNMLEACGVTSDVPIAYMGMEEQLEFRSILDCTGAFDYDKLEQELVSRARQLVAEYPDVGAILLECSDMPPFAWAIQRAVGLPVFDFITMIRWIYYGIVQRPYEGFS
jgi:Asp/Glu/hydantoin racemase